ncbi:MAG: tryptophan synthase subunit alpha [Candidatus Ancillula sp.]|jgi:tryptophan synthase alpha chain|nr:tryptophan synthase subunit alpha [Candidatus Ancillula sp.]
MAKFVAYLPVGFPNFDVSLQAFKVLIDAGANVLEVGVPYSDPVMDGKTIQNATKVSIQNGFRFDDVYSLLNQIHEYATWKLNVGQISEPVQIFVMGYYNMFLKQGLENFAKSAGFNGATGVIIPDLIPDEAETWLEIAKSNNLQTVFLTSPNSTDSRLDLIVSKSSGFIYASSLLGTTGERDDSGQFKNAADIVGRVQAAKMRKIITTPVYLGLGVSTPEQARAISTFADGVIVGSRLVTALEKGLSELFGVAKSFAEAVH